MSDTAATPPVQAGKSGAEGAPQKPRVFFLVAGAVIAAALYAGLTYLNDAMVHESTDDAFITAHIVSVAPRVSGPAVAVHVADNQIVRSNELLVEIEGVAFSHKEPVPA